MGAVVFPFSLKSSVAANSRRKARRQSGSNPEPAPRASRREAFGTRRETSTDAGLQAHLRRHSYGRTSSRLGTRPEGISRSRAAYRQGSAGSREGTVDILRREHLARTV